MCGIKPVLDDWQHSSTNQCHPSILNFSNLLVQYTSFFLFLSHIPSQFFHSMDATAFTNAIVEISNYVQSLEQRVAQQHTTNNTLASQVKQQQTQIAHLTAQLSTALGEASKSTPNRSLKKKNPSTSKKKLSDERSQKSQRYLKLHSHSLFVLLCNVIIG